MLPRQDLLGHGPRSQVDLLRRFHLKGLVATTDDFLSTTFPEVKAHAELNVSEASCSLTVLSFLYFILYTSQQWKSEME